MKSPPTPKRAAPAGRLPLAVKSLDLSLFRRRLLSWYDLRRRDLPWRHTKDPYAIFVSEMMLQQTQVKTVLPYYAEWMRAYPTWHALSRAPIDRVLRSWEGLGYYRRARNLKAAAQMVMEEFGGSLPDEEEELRRLPGVGPYSAGAILSIAFQRPMPLVDGNVARVFARLFVLTGDLRKGPKQRTLWRVARELLDERRPGDFNQALMELGATVCSPEGPACDLCPLQTICLADQKGAQDRYPTPRPSPKTHQVFLAAAFIEENGRVLLRRRSQDARWWQGLWELPTEEGPSPETALSRLTKSLGVHAEIPALARVQHQVTHHRIDLRAYRCSNPILSPKISWFWSNSSSKRMSKPLSSAQKKLWRLLTTLDGPPTHHFKTAKQRDLI